MQYAKSLSQKIVEASEEGRWITTRHGAKVFIKGDRLASKGKEAKDIIKGERDIQSKIIEKNTSVVSYDDVKEELGVKGEILVPKKDMVIVEMNKLPDSHKTLIDKIVIENKARIASFKTDDGKIEKGLLAGELQTNMDTGETTLKLYPSFRSIATGERREIRTIRHEVGHAVFNNLNDNTQQEWNALSIVGYKPNTYAKSKPRENFAEHYRMYSEGGAEKTMIEKSTTPMQLKFLRTVFNKV